MFLPKVYETLTYEYVTCCVAVLWACWVVLIGEGDGAGTYIFDERGNVEGAVCTGCALDITILRALCFRGN